MTSDNCGDETSEKNWLIYKERMSGYSFKETAKKFGITPERVSQIVIKCEKVREVIKFREESPPDSLAGMRLTLNIRERILDSTYSDLRSIKVMDFLKQFSAKEMLRCCGFGRGGLDFFARQAETVVGKDVMMRWLYGEKL